MTKIDIDNFKVNRAMGTSSEWKLLGFNEQQIKDLNDIGYSGKVGNKKMNIHEYFKKFIDTNKTKYKIETVAFSSGEYTDTLLITRVKI